jgi:hypothetical protein
MVKLLCMCVERQTVIEDRDTTLRLSNHSTDLGSRLDLITSDPVISILRNSLCRQRSPVPTRTSRIVVSEATRTGALDPST